MKKKQSYFFDATLSICHMPCRQFTKYKRRCGKIASCIVCEIQTIIDRAESNDPSVEFPYEGVLFLGSIFDTFFLSFASPLSFTITSPSSRNTFSIRIADVSEANGHSSVKCASNCFRLFCYFNLCCTFVFLGVVAPDRQASSIPEEEKMQFRHEETVQWS